MKWRTTGMWLLAILALGLLPWLGSPTPSVPPTAAPTPEVEASAAEVRRAVRPARPVERPAAEVLAAATVAEPLAAFRQWAEAYLGAPDEKTRQGLEAQGMALAERRAEVMAELIRQSPAAALAAALPRTWYGQLPATVSARLEQVVAGTGFYGVKAICGEGPAGKEADDSALAYRIEREVLLGDAEYRAHIYGARWRRQTEENASLFGVAVGRDLALHEADVVPLTAADLWPGEWAAAGLAEPSPAAKAVLYHGRVVALADEAAYARWEAERLAAKQPASEPPLAAAGEVFDPLNPPTGSTPPTVAYNEYTGTNSHQKGPKTVMVFLVVASDGTEWTNPKSSTTLDGELTTASQWYYNASFRQTWFGPKVKNVGTANEFTVERIVVTPVMNLPKTIQQYKNSFGSLQTDCLAAARALGGEWNGGTRDPNHFDRWVVMSNTSLINATGLAYVGGRFSWPNNSLNSGVAYHEWGHNWGVVHGNSWTVAAGVHPRSPTGSHSEYGDGRDPMGGSANTFNALFREELGFNTVAENEVAVVTSSGRFRLFDGADGASKNATSRLRVLKLPITGTGGSDKILYLGFHHDGGTDGGTARADWDRNAVRLHSANTSPNSDNNDGSHHLDTTPKSRTSNDQDDAALKIGRTYSEGAEVNGTNLYGGLHVTPVARGSVLVGGNTHEYIDVQVNLGAFASNQAPSLALAASTTTPAPGATITLTATASDANGDELAYDWTFGDARYSINNSPTQTISWAAAGLYRVYCTVTDMKGGTTRQSLWINVGNLPYRTPENPTATLAGLDYRYYEGTYSTLPNFDRQWPRRDGVVDGLSLAPRLQNDSFAFVYEGFLEVPTTDIYTLILSLDDGARLWLGSTLVIDSNNLKSSTTEASANVALAAGRHALRIEFFHNTGAEVLALDWETTAQARTAVPGTAFFRRDWGSNLPPTTALMSPVAGAEFTVGSNLGLSATASDENGIARVQYFGGGAYLGEATSAPYGVTWAKLPVGEQTVQALAYDSTGRWARSAPVVFTVVSPPPRAQIAGTFVGSAGDSGRLYSGEVAGAIYTTANWNNLENDTGTGVALRDYTGAVSGATATWASAGAGSGTAQNQADVSTPNGRLMRGYIFRRNDIEPAPSLELRALPYPEYDLYVYADLIETSGDDRQPMMVRVTPLDGATAPAPRFLQNSRTANDGLGDYPQYDAFIGFQEAVALTPGAPEAQRMGNYVVFRNLTSPDVRIEADDRVPTDTAQRQVRLLTAFQVVETPATQPRLRVLPTGGSTTVAEGGASDTYQLALTVAPTAAVTVEINAGPQLSVVPAAVTFTPADWVSPRVVAVQAVNDAVAEARSLATNIVHQVASGTTGNYAAVANVSLPVTVADDDTALVAVQASGEAKEAGPVAGFFQFSRGGVSAVASPLTVNFTLGGTAAVGTDFALAGGSVNVVGGVGTVTIPAGAAEVFVSVSPVNDTAAEGPETVSLTLTAGSGYELGTPTNASQTIADDDRRDYFAQYFATNQLESTFDLVNRRLTLTPDGTVSFYRANLTTATSFPTSTSGHTNLETSGTLTGSVDDGFWTVSQPAKLFGVSYTTLYVSTNGIVTFNGGQSSTSGNLGATSLFARPGVAAYWRDLHAGTNGDVFVGRITTSGQERTVVTYSNVARYNVSGERINAQIEFWDSGVITITWLSCHANATNPVVGLSPGGNAVPSGFVESNLSLYPDSVASNTAPVIATLAPNRATGGEFFQWTVAATDPNQQALTWSAPTLPAWLTLTDAGNGTATASGTPPSGGGTATVRVRVTDSGALFAEQEWTLAIVPAGGNAAPVITSAPPGLVTVGSMVTVPLTATDANGQALVWSAPTLPPWLTLTDAGNGTATLTGAVPPGALSSPATVQVTDGLATTAQSFVVGTQLAPEVTLVSPAPGLVQLPDLADTLHLIATVTDDGLPTPAQVTTQWSLVSGPGTVTWSGQNTSAATAKFSTAGFYTLQLAASDGLATTTVPVFVAVEAVAAAELATNLVGYWKFDEGTGTSAADSSGNNLAGTLAGSATWAATGYRGAALRLPGGNSDQVNVTRLANSGRQSFAAWVQLQETPLTKARHLWGMSDNEVRLGVLSSGQLEFVSDRSTDGLWRTVMPLPAGVWVHVAATYDATSTANDPIVYVNGLAQPLVRTQAPTGTAGSVAGTMELGNYNKTGWKGLLDEVRVYDRVLSADEVRLAALAVEAVNQAPNVSAGADRDVAAGATVALEGAATDDGLPTAPGALTTLWTTVASPATVSLGDATALTSPVTIGEVPGAYRLRLTASDEAATVSQTVTLTVLGTPPDGLTTWLDTYPGLTGDDRLPLADPDGDLLPNLVEYALGLHPGQSSPDGMPLVVPSLDPVSGDPHVSITYRQRRGGTGTIGVDYRAGGVTYAVAVSDSPSSGWQTGATLVEMVGTPVANADGITETVTVRTKAAVTSQPDQRTFLRLHLTY